MREAEARAEAERKARKKAEEAAREAWRKAQAEELAAKQAQEARRRAAGWAWFLAIVLAIGGLALYGWWQKASKTSGSWQRESETSKARIWGLAQENENLRNAQEETEAKTAQEGVKEIAAGNVFPLDLGNGIHLEMVHCPGVAVDFWMGKYEVTQEQWRQVTGKSPSHFGGKPRNPVENVSWYDCQDFVKALNALPAARNSGLTFRLPEEREWEKACRAGAPESADYCKLEDGLQITEATLYRVARYEKGWDDGAVTVGSFQPNAWGLYDMHGNVWEWTQTAIDGFRVFRGGSFRDTAWLCTAGYRTRLTPDRVYRNIGFRLAASCRTATR